MQSQSPKWLLLLPLLFIGEAILNVLIIKKVPYTEIDWIAYMQEVGGFLSGELDYTKLKGDTGPCVYPAGFIYVFSLLFHVTNEGKDILLAQYIFAALYCCFIAVVFLIYKNTKQIPWYGFVLLCLSRRIHSIFVLRLFNDCIAMLLLYIAIYLFIKQRWSLGCFVYSFAVSIKMNILLFAPGLLLLLLKTFGVKKTIPKLTICAVLQLVLAIPFLTVNPWGYIQRSFDLGRKFFHIWTVNLKFLPEDIFLSDTVAITLLALHVVFLIVFLVFKWTSHEGGVVKSVNANDAPQRKLSASHIVYVLFTSNFIGVVFARSLHFQFYVWYFHTLPFLLWTIPNNRLPTILKVVILFGIELIWNIFPSNAVTSFSLTCIHVLLVVWLLCFSVVPQPYEKTKTLNTDVQQQESDAAPATSKKSKKAKKID